MKHQQEINIIRRFGEARIAVVGDLMLDRYVWGHASRISQEAPVPVVQVDRESRAPGGAANVARNVCSLGGQAWIFGIVGTDPHGENLIAEMRAGGVHTEGIVVSNERGTTVKTRVLAGNQQVVRIDREETGPVDEGTRARICRQIIACMEEKTISAVIVEDYAKGLLSAEMLHELTVVGNREGIMVSLDPHASHPFNVPGMKLLTPNRAEAFALAGIYPENPVLPVEQDRALLAAGKKLLAGWQPEMLLITLGGHGMALFHPDGGLVHIPTKAREVFDVSGAGDTVMAAFTLALVCGASPTCAANIANHAAGIVVAEVGTAQVTATELIDAMQMDEH